MEKGLRSHCSYRLMNSLAHRRRAALLTTLLILAWAVPVLAEIQPYKARYSIYRNGSLTGKVEVMMAPESLLRLMAIES